MQALLFGSTGSVVETARLERLAYNAAFDELGLDLYWNVATYCKLLELPGGPRRLDTVFGDDWLAGLTEEVYELQQNHFERLAARGLQLRPGVADALEFCQTRGIRLGLISTATPAMLDTLFRHTHGIAQETFDIVCSRNDMAREKPDPAIYEHALDVLRIDASEGVAIEDASIGQAAALAAGLQCYLFPGEYAHVDHDVLVTRDVAGTVRRVHSLLAAYNEWAHNQA